MFMPKILELKGISKRYKVDEGDFKALDSIDLTFGPTGFNTVLGPSGCGKTTLLNVIGGLDVHNEGTLLIDGTDTTAFKDADWDDYRNKKVGFVFQTYYLIPHLNILENVEMPLRLRGFSKIDREKAAIEALKSVGIEDGYQKKPSELSGGQQQRVAIARAIVGHPSIILADEPTGALDSKTSVQVMDILKGLSSKTAVIMVTHNRELAQRYGDRLIEMKDGRIVSDKVIKEKTDVPSSEKGEDGRKSAMSFATAVLTSLKSIRAKLGRSLVTSLACSIGIVGVALVLAVANGFQNYIDRTEASVAGSVPVTISPAYYGSVSNSEGVDFTPYPDSDELYVYDPSYTSYVAHLNKYDAFYIQYLEEAVEKGLASSIMLNRQDFSFNVLTEEGDTGYYTMVNQWNSASFIGSLVSGLPSTIFHELYGDKDTVSSNYDLIYGKFPEKAEEIVLVTDKYNRIQVSTLQGLGIISDQEKTESGTAIPFSDLIYDGDRDEEYKPYKAYRMSDFYGLPENKPLVYEAENNVIDAIKPVDANGNVLPTSQLLQAHHFEVESHTETKEIHYYDSPYHPYENAIDIFENDAKYNPIELKIVGVLRPSASSVLTMVPSSIGYTKELSDILASDVAEGGAGHEIGALTADNYVISKNGLNNLKELLSTPLSDLLNSEDPSNIQSKVSRIYSCFYPWAYHGTLPGNDNNPAGYLAYNRMVGGNMAENIDVDLNNLLLLTTKFIDPAFYNGTSKDYGLFDLVAYINGGNLVTSISVFPSTLGSKGALLDYLDAYNEGKDEDDRIYYSDIMGTVTSALSVVTTVVPAVLIVFASVSLVVSSLMMAVITYVSVLERTKEIGILRSYGARKRDIRRLFEIECSLIGVVAGVIGILFSLVLCLPINLILNNFFPEFALGAIASLNVWAALILIVFAILLALVGGLVPAVIAAKKDPVLALRSE